MPQNPLLGIHRVRLCTEPYCDLSSTSYKLQRNMFSIRPTLFPWGFHFKYSCRASQLYMKPKFILHYLFLTENIHTTGYSTVQIASGNNLVLQISRGTLRFRRCSTGNGQRQATKRIFLQSALLVRRESKFTKVFGKKSRDVWFHSP